MGAPSKLGGHAAHGHVHAQRQGRQGGGYIAPADDLAGYGLDARESEVVELRAEPAPVVGIRAYSFDTPQPGFRYNFETEDDHVQNVEGTMKKVGETEVVVMEGRMHFRQYFGKHNSRCPLSFRTPRLCICAHVDPVHECGAWFRSVHHPQRHRSKRVCKIRDSVRAGMECAHDWGINLVAISLACTCP